ncbi:MAG: hypothetical protein II367_02565 [Treponema sp.]|nr:hypothetical protein [Treponema sp.]
MNDVEGYADGEEPLHFYYNREERIKRAPKIVQDYYAGKMQGSSKGLFRTLFATRGNRFMFSGIVVFMVFIWLYSFVFDSAFSHFHGSKVELTCFSYEETVYASLKLNAVKDRKGKSVKDRFPVPLKVVFSAVDSAGGVSDEAEENTVFSGDELFVRTKFSDYDIVKVKAVLSDGTEDKQFVSVVQHR